MAGRVLDEKCTMGADSLSDRFFLSIQYNSIFSNDRPNDKNDNGGREAIGQKIETGDREHSLSRDIYY